MAYPEILYRGQYTLKRVLTMPATSTLTDVLIAPPTAAIGDLVSVDASGLIIPAPANAAFFGVLRAINTEDDTASVDFSGVHEFIANVDISAGEAIVPSSSTRVTPGTGTTKAVALNPALAGEKVQVFFLN